MALAAALVCGSVRAEEAVAPRVVKLTGDRLTVHVEGVQLEDVLRTFADVSGARIKGGVVAPREVTAQFDEVPLQEGLHRLLGDQNFMLSFGQDGRPKTLTLLGGPQAAPLGTQVVKTAPAAGSTRATPSEILLRAVPVPAGSTLAQHLGQDSATLQQLVDISMRNDDRVLRTEAIRAGMQAIESQPDLRATVVESLINVDDATLESVVRAMAHDKANELVAQMAALTKDNDLRARGFRLLKHLNTPPGKRDK